MKLPYAEDMNYWKSGRSEPDKWLESASKIITDLGGKVVSYAYGIDDTTGKAAYLFAFKFGADMFKVVWPILPTRSGREERDAKRQAATMLYHDIKAQVLKAYIWGPKTAYFHYMMLPDGRTAAQASIEELAFGIPAMFLSGDIKLLTK